ncbi:MAG: DUF389 domain-containing protein [Rhodocyclaceae bacterium]|nr:DUF389 domain-containing protein [Rhodocyclaceae bacterium]MBP6278229.1 DUF389 domain-containing protein [Rhodocyclaceae bacterium]
MNKKLDHLPWQKLFSLRQDQASPDLIDTTIRNATEVGGTNLWVLMFAIIIASVGLNVNSTAVVIGAMLISPLMGPIIGIGYGAGIDDFLLIRRSIRHLGIFVGISLFTSTVYFFVTPLTQAHSELLARTAPTIWDVLIAFFGGAAGMIGLTRKEKSTLLPGVAIATALMPPLCTAGYGLATGQLKFFLGASYLFLINGVFIAFATLVVTRILKLPPHPLADEQARKQGHRFVIGIVMATLLPSVYLATKLVREELFVAESIRFTSAVAAGNDSLVTLGREIDPKTRTITMTLIGNDNIVEMRRSLETQMAKFDLAGASLKIRRAADAADEVAALSPTLDAQAEAVRVGQIARDLMERRIAALEMVRKTYPISLDETLRLEQEILINFPRMQQVVVAIRSEHSQTADILTSQLIVTVQVKSIPNRADTQRLKRWLSARFPDRPIKLILGKTLG